MGETIPVLIVEDDFRIADINRRLLIVWKALLCHMLLKRVRRRLLIYAALQLPQLILLDVYIPDREGLTLFWPLRQEFNDVDVIMVTAANEVETIAETLRGGIFDYIVKPVDFDRFEQTLNIQMCKTSSCRQREELDQEEIDLLTGAKAAASQEKGGEGKLPKGIDQLTLEKIKNVLQQSSEFGADGIGRRKQSGGEPIDRQTLS